MTDPENNRIQAMGLTDRSSPVYSVVKSAMDFIKNISPTELIIVVLILIIFFGGRLVTNLARTSGETVKELKNIKKEFTKAIEGDEKKS